MSNTVERTPRFSKNMAQMRPEMPPPMMATSGSSENGAVKVTCSWMKVFLSVDFLEVPYDGFFLRFLKEFITVGNRLVLVVVPVGVVKAKGNTTFEVLRLRGWRRSMVFDFESLGFECNTWFCSPLLLLTAKTNAAFYHWIKLVLI